ncbi:MAG: amidohydrolase family protein [Patescibacteria group bacterium]
MAYDIIIKGGSVLDGTGNPAGVNDIAIDDGKIAHVGALPRTTAKTEITVPGKIVAPGFIDITNHADTHLTLFKYPLQESMVMQGVTTIIGGNCGASLAPLVSREAIHGLSKWADLSDLGINWTSMDEFLQAVEQVRPGVNFGTFAGFGTLRRGVSPGNDAGPLSLENRAKAALLAERAVAEGAFGLSFGLAYGHERSSSTEELIEVARPLARAGGILKVHLRSEGAEVLAAVNEAIQIGRETGATVIISHLKVIGRKSWPLAQKALDLIAYARLSGVAIWFDVSPYRTTGSPLYLLVPAWARRGGLHDLFDRMRSQTERKRIVEALAATTLHYDRIRVIAAKHASIVGKTIAEIAEGMTLPPEEAMLEVIRGSEGRVTIIGRTISAKNTARAAQNPHGLVASDGYGLSQDAEKSGMLAHPRCFGAFPHFWHRFVNDLKTLKPEEAIVKISGGPARLLGLADRGTITKGNAADIVIFDPRLIRDRATYQNPYRYPVGIEWVMVNGKIVVAQGQHTGARAGQVLRKHKVQ